MSVARSKPHAFESGRGLTAALVVAGLLAGPAASSAAGPNTWFAGGGFEAPRVGQGLLARFNGTGPSFVGGIEHEIRGTTGITMRVGYVRFPVNPSAQSDFDPTGTSTLQNAPASLTTLVGGLRFRRRDLAFSPYFDFGMGMGVVRVNRVINSPSGYYANTSKHVALAYVWSWGAGAAWHPPGRYGGFVDGHWDTVPGSPSDQAWTASVRAGVERR